MYAIKDYRKREIIYTCDTKTDALLQLELIRYKAGTMNDHYVICEVEEDPITPGVYLEHI